MGDWPEATLKGTLAKYWFYYGYRKIMPPNKYDTIKLTVYDIAGEDVNVVDELINPFMDSSGNIPYSDLSEGLRTLLDCNVLVFLIDGSRINAEPRSKPYEEMLRYDTFMATLISIVADYKSRNAKELGERNKIYPVFVITKFDMIDKKIFEKLSIEEKYPRYEKNFFGMRKDKKKIYAEKIISAFYPQTLALKHGGKLVNVNFDKAGYFFSDMKTELNDDGIISPSLITRDSADFRIGFSYNEYKDFIIYFRDIAKSMPDEVKDEQEFNKL